MQRLEVSCALRRLYRSLGVKGLITILILSSHLGVGLPNVYFLQVYPTKPSVYVSSPHACPAYLTLLS